MSDVIGLAATARARAWHHGRHVAVCDSLEPWAHGTVVRADRYPTYFDYNLVRVEDDPGVSVEALATFADEALAGLAHRRIDFDDVAAAEPLRAGFEARGWKAVRLVLMRHEAPPPPGAPHLAVEEVPYDAVHDLRVSWHREDHGDREPSGYHESAREVALSRGARLLAAHEGAAPVSFAQLEYAGDAAEITQVYVHPERRGRGLGTATTRAAIDAAGAVADLWIGADDEDRPKQLYARLGFRPVWTSMEMTLWPPPTSSPSSASSPRRAAAG
jgi:GNAT superfamily N-acetyltransferase